ncbi:MAG: hypothetical protein GEV11_27335 [Streptosporangiales bacterium]|nr:hypothetical protein [Streptosporangiales bacterium]
MTTGPGAAPAEPVTRSPRRDVAFPASTQVWQDVVFLHWAYDPAELRHLVPEGTRLDTRGGVTWVGVVALRLAGVRVGGVIPLAHLGDFHELNVRLGRCTPPSSWTTPTRACSRRWTSRRHGDRPAACCTPRGCTPAAGSRSRPSDRPSGRPRPRSWNDSGLMTTRSG